jgi:hypothetical protein
MQLALFFLVTFTAVSLQGLVLTEYPSSITLNIRDSGFLFQSMPWLLRMKAYKISAEFPAAYRRALAAVRTRKQSDQTISAEVLL